MENLRQLNKKLERFKTYLNQDFLTSTLSDGLRKEFKSIRDWLFDYNTLLTKQEPIEDFIKSEIGAKTYGRNLSDLVFETLVKQKSTIETWKLNYEQLQKEFIEYSEQRNPKMEIIKRLKDEINGLKKSLEYSDTDKANFADQLSKVKDLNADLANSNYEHVKRQAEKNSEIRKLKFEINGFEKTNESLRERNKILNSEHKSIQIKAEGWKKLVSDKDREIHSLKNDIRVLQNQYDSVSLQLQAANRAFDRKPHEGYTFNPSSFKNEASVKDFQENIYSFGKNKNETFVFDSNTIINPVASEWVVKDNIIINSDKITENTNLREALVEYQGLNQKKADEIFKLKDKVEQFRQSNQCLKDEIKEKTYKINDLEREKGNVFKVAIKLENEKAAQSELIDNLRKNKWYDFAFIGILFLMVLAILIKLVNS